MKGKLQLSQEELDRALKALDNFIWELQDRSIQDAWCLEMAAEVANRVEGYDNAVKDLTPEQREAIEDYIAACEELEYSHVYIAYALGREHQRLGIPAPLFLGYMQKT